MIYKYVWQTCQQSLKIISIEQSLVRGNYTVSELCSSRKYPYPHPPTEGRNSNGRGVQKEVISEELVGCLPLLTEVFSGRLSKISKLLYFHRSSKLLLLFAVVIFDLRSAKCVFFFTFFLTSFLFIFPIRI